MCSRELVVAVALTAALGMSAAAHALPVVFTAGGSNDPSSIQATVDSFRTALGSPNNGDSPGPLLNGRREINWDGGGSTANAAVGTPFIGFLNTRGVQITTPGTGFVQAPASASGSADDLGTYFGNASYDNTFGVFSQARVFVPVASNVTDVLFFIPGFGGATSATVSGFGAVFSDVDLASTTSIAFFDVLNNPLYQYFVPVGTVANQSLSFLGVIDNDAVISRVRITTGNSVLSGSSSESSTNGADLVVMDDFLYSEPSQAVPEPPSLALLGLGLAGLGFSRRRSH